MKNKYYLARTARDGWILARGKPFEIDIEGLALVRLDAYHDQSFKGNFTIIDIRSGLSAMTHYSKKKLLEAFASRDFDELKEAIEKARNTDSYKNKRLVEFEKARQQWIASGIEIEGE